MYNDIFYYKLFPNSDSEKIENRLIFGEVIKRTKIVPLFGPPCTVRTGHRAVLKSKTKQSTKNTTS